MEANEKSTAQPPAAVNVPDLLELIAHAWRPAAVGAIVGGVLLIAASFLFEPVYRAKVIVE